MASLTLRPVKILGHTVHMQQKLDEGTDHPRAGELQDTLAFYGAAWKMLSAEEKDQARRDLEAEVVARNAALRIPDAGEFTTEAIDRAIASLEG